MNLKLERIFADGQATVGILFIDDIARCFILEDEHRDAKVLGETRIPAGRYRLKLRHVGESPRFDAAYGQRLGAIYVGMIEVVDVPNFSGILIHTGTVEQDTAGCLLVGFSAYLNQVPHFIGDSRVAFAALYPLLSRRLARGEESWIEIIDRDRLQKDIKS